VAPANIIIVPKRAVVKETPAEVISRSCPKSALSILHHTPLFPSLLHWSAIARLVGQPATMKSFVLPLIALVLHLATGHAYSPQIARRATCGVKGYDRGSPQAYYYSTKPVELSEAGCGAVCAAESACNSFAIGSDACLLYTSSL